jgi:hypothetical protein
MPPPNPSWPDREDISNGKSRTGELAANQPNAFDRFHDLYVPGWGSKPKHAEFSEAFIFNNL